LISIKAASAGQAKHIRMNSSISENLINRSGNNMRTHLKAALCLSILIFCCALPCLAENPPAIQWQKSFGGSGTEQCAVVHKTSDGSYIFGGYSDSAPSGTKTSASFGLGDYWLIKSDALGNEVWQQSFGGNNVDLPWCVADTDDGGLLVGGYSDSYFSGNKTNDLPDGPYGDGWLLRLDANGSNVWQRGFLGAFLNDDPRATLYDMAKTSDGGFLLTGTSNGTCVAKINGDGQTLWEKRFSQSDSEMPRLALTSDDGFFLSAMPGVFADRDPVVIRADSTGEIVWEKSFGGTGVDGFYCVRTTPDGGCVLAGYSNSPVSTNKTAPNWGGDDFWLVKLDGNGNRMWDQTFGGTNSDVGNSVCLMPDGGYLVVGYSDSGISGNKSGPNFGKLDGWVVRTDSLGNKLWDLTLGGNDYDFLLDARPTADGGILLFGDSASPISGNKTSTNYGSFDYWIVKLEGPTPPSLLQPVLTNNTATLTWTSISNRSYRLQSTSNLATNWQDLSPDILATNATASATIGINGQSQQFYRLLLLP
jgi:hypothetical protein